MLGRVRNPGLRGCRIDQDPGAVELSMMYTFRCIEGSDAGGVQTSRGTVYTVCREFEFVRVQRAELVLLDGGQSL